MSYTQIENILGQPIPDYVINQLRIRSKKTLDKRDNQALVYTANKSGWVRVVSSVDISGSLAGINTANGADLAKSSVLFGGLSAYKGNNTYSQFPYYSSDPETARKNQFDSDYGFRPMPGITSAKIITQGKLGSILIAEIDFKANTKEQLDLVDILYFKVGYSMLVEWGNTFFYKQKSTDANNDLSVEDTLYKSEDYAVDPFTDNPSKETVRIAIAKSMKQTEGNYGGMLGVVTNYGFSMNADGGYDCKLKIMSPGMLAESMRVNGIPTLPKIYYDAAIQNLANVFNTVSRQNAEKERERNRLLTDRPTKSSQYPFCVRNRIDNKVFKISIVGEETYAEAVPNQGFEGYQFFSINTNNKYVRILNGVRTEGTYECSGENIRDYNTKKIIGEVQEKEPTYTELYELITNASNSSKYSTQTTNPYFKNPSLIDYYVKDLSRKNKDSKYYQFYLFSKFKKYVYLRSGTNQPFDKLVAKLKLGFNYNNETNGNLFGIYKEQTDKDWSIILSGREKTIEETDTNYTINGLPGRSFRNQFEVVEYNASGTGNRTYYSIDYADGARQFTDTVRLDLNYTNEYIKVSSYTYPTTVKGKQVDKITPGSVQLDPNDRSKIHNAINAYFNAPGAADWTIVSINADATGTYIKATQTIRVEDLSATVSFKETATEKAPPDERIYVPQTVQLTIDFRDLDLLEFIQTQAEKDTQQQAQLNATQQPSEPPLEYPIIKASDLSKTEQAMYTSQLEAMLRMVQITTIGDNYGDGTINSVKKIEWTSPKYSDRLYNGLFSEGAMMTRDGQSILKQVVTATSNESTGKIFENGSISDDAKNRYVNGAMTNLPRYTMNLYYGFHRGMMKTDDVQPFKDFDKPEYKVNFKELLTSYVIPYYQSKTLIDGADIHYPSYIPLGFFFMMLNHCSFLYDTSDNIANIPMFYLDFNQGTNIMLSSDFMLTSNPYKFVVPFTGDVNSYKKLFGPGIINSDGMTVGSGSEASPLWVNDAVSDYIPRFKYIDASSSGISPYRGKTMNVLVSIDYLLDVVKRHARIDETNSVYFRPLIEELLSDLGKCLGNFNIFRLAYDDYSNCFYVVDDQTIPGDYTYFQNSNKNIELPLFGKDSIARSLTINTENSSKLGNLAFISANQDVRNQSTLGIDGTSIGNLSLYAVDRYKRLATAPNDNKKPSGSAQTDNMQQKQLAASTFNQAVESFYYGGLRSEAIVDQATNYYIEAVARTRAGGEDENIRASSLLPISVNFSTDGISSMAIYQAFTISNELLPYSYKYGMNQSETRQMGFIITGLEHTIQNNAWTTDVRANMYYVKRQGDYKTQIGKQTKAEKFKDLPIALLSGGTGATGAGGCTRTSADDNSWRDRFPYAGFSSQSTSIPQYIKSVYIPARDRANISMGWGIQVLCEAQAAIEGFTPTSVSYKTNNPGNIGTDTQAGNRRSYATLEEGIRAQVNYVYNSVIRGTTSWAFGATKGDTTLFKYLSIYAPPCYVDSSGLLQNSTNNPTDYTNYIINYFRNNYNITITHNTTFNELSSITRV